MKYTDLVAVVKSGQLKTGSKILYHGHENVVLDVQSYDAPVRGENRKIIDREFRVCALVIGFKLGARKKLGWVTTDDVKRASAALELKEA